MDALVVEKEPQQQVENLDSPSPLQEEEVKEKITHSNTNDANTD
jgi:hypothetical protein